MYSQRDGRGETNEVESESKQLQKILHVDCLKRSITYLQDARRSCSCQSYLERSIAYLRGGEEVVRDCVMIASYDCVIAYLRGGEGGEEVVRDCSR